MATQSSSLPFLPLDELGPLFSIGLLTSTLATSVGIISIHQTLSSHRKSSPLRLGLTIIFLVNVTLFIGGQTAALTFTAVSSECLSRNILATFADQLARISALIIGLNVVARSRFRWGKFALYGWTGIRLIICIVAAALVQRELGEICLPAPNVVTAATGMALDLLLDIYLVFRAFKLLSKSEDDTQQIEFVVLVSSIALLAWHLSSIPLLFRVGTAGSRIVPYCIFLSILTYLLVIFQIKVPNPNYVVLHSQRVAHPQQTVVQVTPPDQIFAQTPGPTPGFVRGVIAPFKRGSGGTTSVTGALTELDREPPLMRYAISKPTPGLPNTYNLVEVPNSRSDSNSIESWRIPMPKSSIIQESTDLPQEPKISQDPVTSSHPKVDTPPQETIKPSDIPLPPLTPPPRIPSIATMGLISGFTEPNSAPSFVSLSPPRPKSVEPSIRTNASSFMGYPVTSMPMPILSPGARKEVPRKMAKDLKVTIPEPTTRNPPRIMEVNFDAYGKVLSDDAFTQDDDLLALSRNVRENAISAPKIAKRLPPTPDALRKSGLIFPPVAKIRDKSKLVNDALPPTPQDTPRSALPSLNDAPPKPRIPRERNSHIPIRERIPLALKARLSRDLATIRNPRISPMEQTDVYTGVLAMLSEAVTETKEDEEDISRHLAKVRLSFAKRNISDEDAIYELHQLSRAVYESQGVSDAILDIYASLSTTSPNTAFAMLDELIEDRTPQSSRYNSIAAETQLLRHKRSRSDIVSEANSVIGRQLNQKLAEIDGPISAVELGSLDFTRPNTFSRRSMDILNKLEDEFALVDSRHSRGRDSTDTLSSLSTISSDDNTLTADEVSPSQSPGWRPSAQMSAAAERVIQSKVAQPTSSITFEVDENSTERALSTRRSSQPGRHSPLPRPNTQLDAQGQRHNDLPRSVGLPRSREQNHAHVEDNPATTPRINSKVVRVAPVPVQRVNFREMSRSLSKNGELWRPSPPQKPNKNVGGLWKQDTTFADTKRIHRDINFNSDDNETRLRTVATRTDVPIVSLPSNSTLWQPKKVFVRPSTLLWQPIHSIQIQMEVELPQNLSISSDVEELDKNDSCRDGQLWAPPVAPEPIRTTNAYGLWARTSAPMNVPRLSHSQWDYVESVRYPLSILPDALTTTSEGFGGLWTKPKPKPKKGVVPGLWTDQHNSRSIQPDATLSSRNSEFLDDISLTLDARISSIYSEESTDSKSQARGSFLRVMNFQFPLPPISPSSPRPRTAPADLSASVVFDDNNARVSPTAFNNSLMPSDSAHVHPVFINSDLHPNDSSFFSSEEEYPSDRLHPACMGYFNHHEYEAAMSSINAIEAMYLRRSAMTDSDTMSEVSEHTLRHRRSKKRALSPFWRNRIGDLSLKLDLISAKNAVISHLNPFSRTPTSSKYSEASPLKIVQRV